MEGIVGPTFKNFKSPPKRLVNERRSKDYLYHRRRRAKKAQQRKEG